jgi:hypothetical protein
MGLCAGQAAPHLLLLVKRGSSGLPKTPHKELFVADLTASDKLKLEWFHRMSSRYMLNFSDQPTVRFQTSGQASPCGRHV